jgi:hypothetical protein
MRCLAFVLALLFAFPALSRAGAGRDFDGANDEMVMGANYNVTTNSVSVCLWSSVDAGTAAKFHIGRKNAIDNAAGYALYHSAGELARFIVADGTDNAHTTGTTTLDATFRWLCGVWNSATTTSSIYVNGVAEDNVTNALVGSLSNTIDFGVGEERDGGGDFDGRLAYAMVFISTSLTVPEVNELMWKPGSIIATGLWPTWGSNSPEINLAGTGINGTLVGTTESLATGPPVMIGDTSL